MAMRKKRQAARTIFIACEGKNTEPIYFEGLAEDLGVTVQVTVHPEEDAKTGKRVNHANNPLRLVEEAISRKKDGFDELWAVFDKDGHADTEKAYKKAKDNHIKIAFSSRSFEHWVLLHFEKNKTPFPKTQCRDANDQPLGCGKGIHPDDCHGTLCLVGKLETEGYFPDYNKSSHVPIYKNLRAKTTIATENAAWLRLQQKPDIAAAHGSLINLNPYTDIDELLKSIFGLSDQNLENIIWINLTETANLEGLKVTLRDYDTQQMILDIENTEGASFVLNQTNLSNYCFLTNPEGQSENVNIENAIVIPSQSSQAVILKTNNDLTNKCFNFKHKNNKMMVQL